MTFQAQRQYENHMASSRTIERVDDGISLTPKRSGGKESGISTATKKPTLPMAETPRGAAVEGGEIGDPKLAMMKRMIETLTGKKIKLHHMSEYVHDDSGRRGLQSGFDSIDRFKANGDSDISARDISARLPRFPPNSSLFSVDATAPISIRSGNLGSRVQGRLDPTQIEIPVQRVKITEVHSFYEAEETTFQGQGRVETGDGRVIDFALDLSMSRAYYEEERSEMTTEAVLVDPLVINFDGRAADLTDVRFSFDLDTDGETEEIPWLASGSGFLVLDRNGDGVVNDGSELFGPESGNGFQDLAALDDDGNGWIDEGDAAFDKLSVWSGERPDKAGLQSLKATGVGAIALSSADTRFSINDEESNMARGQVRRTGIYLKEDGAVGTVQQVDLAV